MTFLKGRTWLVLLLMVAVLAGAARWRAQGRGVWVQIAPGVEMRSLRAMSGAQTVSVIALRTTASRVQIAGGELLSAAQWRARRGALAAINGGFFDAEGRSLGLRIARGRVIAPLHGTRWGIFAVRGGKASIGSATSFNKRGVSEAVQCGPLLVLNGRARPVKNQWARRTGLGVQRDGRVIIAVADGELSLPAWAQLWAASDGLNCRDALNLDGGSSTQLSLHSARRSLEITTHRTVPDAVVIN